jgi:hypothetical protein
MGVVTRDDASVRLHTTAPQTKLSELAPWLSEYEEELNRLLKWGDHEAIDYPVAGTCLFCTGAIVQPLFCGIKHVNSTSVTAPVVKEVAYAVHLFPPCCTAAIFAIPADVAHPVEHIELLHKEVQMPPLMKQEVGWHRL